MSESDEDVPVLAFKRAYLVPMPNGGVAFGPIFQAHHFYGADDEAKCPYLSQIDAVADECSITTENLVAQLAWIDEHGPIPGTHCTCGFYSMRDPNKVPSGGFVLLTVELSGRIIVCRDGYRAQHQTVVSVRSSGCSHDPGTPFDRLGCGRTDDLIWGSPDGSRCLVPFCAAHADHARRCVVGGDEPFERVEPWEPVTTEVLSERLGAPITIEGARR